MNKLLHWGATFSVNMMMKGSKGVLSIPIYSYIDRTNIIKPTKITINEFNEIQMEFIVSPGSPGDEKRYTKIEYGNKRTDENCCPFNDLK